MFNWNGKNVVYVGDSAGAGVQICQVVVQKPIKHLVVCSRAENADVQKKIQATNNNVKVTFVKVNVTDPSSVQHAAQEVASVVGHVDVLINGGGALADTDIETTVAVNLTTVITSTVAFLPYMDQTQQGQGGVVVNVASVYGLEPNAAFSVYSAAKHGVVGFTRALANEVLHQKTGVAFVCVCPGLTSADVATQKQQQQHGGHGFGEHASTNWVPHTQDLFNAVTQSKTQTPEECAVNVVNVVTQAKNGGVYVCSQGNVKEIVPTVYF